MSSSSPQSTASRRASTQRLSDAQVAQFWAQGFTVAENAVSAAQLSAARADIERWVADSRAESAPFGTPTLDGKPRFDLAPEHTASAPALRRVNNPSDISPAYAENMSNSAIVDMVAELIGPSLKSMRRFMKQCIIKIDGEIVKEIGVKLVSPRTGEVRIVGERDRLV